MIDFTSSLYLGFRHPSDALEPWTSLTTGKPAALGTPALSTIVAKNLAKLQGCESATLLPSTLHLYFDLFEMLRRDDIRIFVDAGAYPIARWAVERAAARGVPVHRLPHFDPRAAREAIATPGTLRPVIVADGYCPSCGRAAPLETYLDGVAPRGGYVVLDDTQALGIWGEPAGPAHPYGRGGGGSVRRHGVRSPRIILGSSLAKGFGAPLAALSGSAALVRRFERQSETRTHSSPPSLAVLDAAHRALALNAQHGDASRRRLAGLVRHFREGVETLGLRPPRSLFPVQELVPGNPLRLRRRLEGRGINTAVVRGCDGGADKIVFVIRAEHRRSDIDHALAAIEREFGSARRVAPGLADRYGSRGRIRTTPSWLETA
jgi:8-amino-7-oxononanoate synthase